MLTIKALYDKNRSGRSIVDYLLDSVADGNGRTESDRDGTRYYTEPGTPAGRWIGDGIEHIGDGELAPGGEVTASQLMRLVSFGVDPVTEEPLGRPGADYRSHKAAVLQELARSDMPLDADGKAYMRASRKVAAGRTSKANAVRAFDATFSPPKSFSTLWAIADNGVREQLEAAHHQALSAALSEIESSVIRTRSGSGGIVQEDTRGVIAARFDHWDSRASDPHLHTHVVIANRVQARDGRWLTIDSRRLLKAAVAASETYDNYLMDATATIVGVDWSIRREGRRAKNTRWEISGIPSSLLDEFSQRFRAINAADEGGADRTQADYGARAKAWAATRTEKKHLALSELRQDWKQRAKAIVGEDLNRLVDEVIGREPTSLWQRLRHRPARRQRQRAIQNQDVPDQDITQLASEVIRRLEADRAAWGYWNIAAESQRVLRSYRLTSPAERQALTDRVIDGAQRLSVDLTSDNGLSTPRALQREDGSSRFVDEKAGLWTSNRVLEAEAYIAARADRSDGPATRMVDAHTYLSQWVSRDGHALSEDQAGAIFEIATSARPLDVLVGPAGAGKTTALAALSDHWQSVNGQGSVIGLAPSAAAAAVLSESIAITSENTAKWLHEHAKLTSNQTELAALRSLQGHSQLTASDVSAAAPTFHHGLPEHARPHQVHARIMDRIRQLDEHQRTWQFKEGQLVIIDEASMAATLPMRDIVEAAEAAGAKVLAVGDPYQLSSIEAGGAFGMLVRSRTAVPELRDVRRFNEDWQKTASLQLRLGDARALQAYQAHGRIHDGDYETIAEEVFAQWIKDRKADRSSLIITPDNETATDLSMRARQWLIDQGHVTGHDTELREGQACSTGDTILTRHNDRRIATSNGTWVRNGQTWTVITAHRDGSLLVRHDNGEMLTLPRAYVHEHVDLAYAITAHRAQGVTVDRAHAMISQSTPREALYVAATRAKGENHLYVITEETLSDTGHGTGETRDAREVLTSVLTRHAGALSAHEQRDHAHDEAHSIHRLAREYEAINTSWRMMWATDLADRALPRETARDLVQHPDFPRLATAMAAAAHNGYAPARVLRSRADACDDVSDLLTTSLSDLSVISAQPPSPRERIAGLFTKADLPNRIDPDIRQALSEREAAITKRAHDLVRHAIAEKEPWIQDLGPLPTDHAAASAWLARATTVAAYRDRYRITTDEALGSAPSGSWQHKRHYAIAQTALSATRSAPQDSTRQHRALTPHRQPNSAHSPRQ